MVLSRRGLLGSLLAAPAVIVTPGLLMPVKKLRLRGPYVILPLPDWLDDMVPPNIRLVHDGGTLPGYVAERHTRHIVA